MKKLSLLLLLFIAAMLLNGGCQWQERQRNIENSARLRVGMSKQQVLEIMGEPLKDEAYASPDVWFYYVDTKWYDGLATHDECMPLVFKDGELAGWGNVYYNDLHLEGNYPE